MHNSFSEYLHNVLFPERFVSGTWCVLKMLPCALKSVNQNRLVGGIFCNLAKHWVV